MPIESYTVIDGHRVDDPQVGATPPASSGQESAPDVGQTGVPGATPESPAGTPEPPVSPTGETPLPGEGESPGDTDDDDAPLHDDSEVNAERLNRRFARLTRLRRQAERQVEQERQQHAVEIAQLRGQQEAVHRMLQGAAPLVPDAPAPQAGPPSAEQYASHEDFVHAAATYATDQRMQQERQQQQHLRFQQDLMSREQTFKAQHPDFDSVVRSGLAGIGGTVLQQALMLVPDGPAVAYALASKPELVQRLLTLPPPLVLVELGRLSAPPPSATSAPAVGGANGTAPAALPTPPTPLSGSGAGAPTGSYNEGMSQREYEAWRKRTSQLPVWKER